MNFKILNIDEYNRNMVIDWGNGVVLAHHIPLEILENVDITKERTMDLIEMMRPNVPEPIEIPQRLKEVFEESNGASYIDNNDGEDVL